MSLLQIVILSIIQGLAELLPVSSSAHVIAVAKLMQINPTTPQFTLLLVLLHTGTMFAVIVYFWRAWKRAFFGSRDGMKRFARLLVIATVATGVVALPLKYGIEAYIKHRNPGIEKAEIEQLFKHLELMSVSLAVAGALILYAGFRTEKMRGCEDITNRDAVAIGAIQGLCLPFRGFSRSGATISLGLLLGIARTRLEEYSFALAVVLTPAVVVWEGRRLVQSHTAAGTQVGWHDFLPGILGMFFSFLAGLLALKLLSRLLERGKWWVFGLYCLAAATGVFVLYCKGY